MEFRALGGSGLKVSAVSYGNWLTHGSQIDVAQAKACVQAALAAGITTFDTADVYANGAAEAILGEALADEPRESLEILTKVFFPIGLRGPNDRSLSRKHIIEAINGSLHRLQTDYVDLYQAHRYDDSIPLEETMTAFADIVRAGKALYIGVSGWTAEQLRAGHALAQDLRVPFISNQPRYNMLDRAIEDEVVPTCRELGIGQVVFSPVAQGVLTGKYLPGRPVPEGSRATDAEGAFYVRKLLTEENLLRVQRLVPLAEAEGLTMAQLAIAWVLQNDNVASAIIGGSRPDQVAANAQAAGHRVVLHHVGRHRRGAGRGPVVARACPGGTGGGHGGRVGGGLGGRVGCRPGGRVSWQWVPDREPDDAIRLTRSFPTQGEAETWLGEFYPELLSAGVRAVTLYEADRLVYGPMSLEPE